MKLIEKCAQGGLAVVLALGMAPLPAFADEMSVATSPVLTSGEQASNVQTASEDYAGTFVFTDAGIDVGEGSTGYKASGTELTINAAGTYHISGSCTEGNIKVKKGTTGVALVLENLSLTSSATAPLAINKDNGNVTVQIEGSVSLTDAENPANETSEDADVADAFEGAAVKVKSGSSATFCGGGTLTVDGANCKNGIKGGAGADLTFESGTYVVSAANNGIAADNSVTINGGTFTIEAANEAIKSSPDDDDTTSLGDVTINGGAFELDAGDDAVHAERNATIAAGDFQIEAGGDAAHGGSSLSIQGGSLYAECQGDGLDSNGALIISGGTTVVWSGSQPENPLDYDGTFTINGGTVVAVGTNSMPVASPRGSQAYATGTLNLSAGGTLSVSEGSSVAYTQKAPKAASYIFYSSPTMTSGNVTFSPAGNGAGNGTMPGNGGMPGGAFGNNGAPGGAPSNGSAPGGNMSAPTGNTSGASAAYSAANTISSSTTSSNNTYVSTTGGQNALLVSGGTSTLTNATVTKTGSPSSRADDYDFYGTNAAALVYNGATLNLSGGKVTTNASYGNGVFATGTGKVILNGTTINTSANNSGGIMVTGGGTLTATDCAVTTLGGSSAPIRSDRGGGTITVNGGAYTSSGSGSPAIYSTADITVNNATLKSGISEGVVVEGKNSVTLNGVNMTSNNTRHNSNNSSVYKGVMLYQSMSGDASVGTSSFTAKDSTITTNNGAVFYVTNTSSVINLSGNTFVSGSGTGTGSGEFLRAESAGWGTSGRNGGNVTLNMTGQQANGKIVVDGISTLTMNMTGGSVFTGALNAANTGKSVVLKLSADSKLVLTGDSYVSSLSNADPTGSNIELNGYTLHIGETPVDDGTSSGAGSGSGQGSQPGMPGSDMPGGTSGPGGSGWNSQTPPASPSADMPSGSNASSGQGVPMYRLYNRWSGEHLYTSDVGEYNRLATVGWKQEGVAWNAPSTSNTPVYRLYNRYSGDHHYTTSRAEYDNLGSIGWTQEGVSFYSDDQQRRPVFRGFNRYATIGTHHYTMNMGEINEMVSNGWSAEGVGWYGMS